jgi:flagellar basal-body rod modification protein FlgD
VPTTTTIGQDAVTTAATTSTSSTSSTGSTGKTTGADGFGMDKDAFLKILVEQLRHQDPSQPGDSQEYVQQMTQYSMLEQLTNISEASQQQQAGDAANTAIALVGHTVTYRDADGETEKSGIVDKVEFADGVPTLTVGGQSGIGLGTVIEVR